MWNDLGPEPPRPSITVSSYDGPERRRGGSTLARWLACMLDETDHGMLLVDAQGGLHHANQPARRELADATSLIAEQRQVRTADPLQQGLLLAALADARQGRRRLVALGAADTPLPVAVVPLDADRPQDGGLVLLVLGKRRSCESLTVDFFARTQGLTAAEARVLHALCKGQRPKEVAREHDVAISTVRTQISSIRAKTNTSSIRQLVDRVGVLPPMSQALKTSAFAA
jgi:DNA-binding CsgD family transcriptional regulator